MKFIRRPDLAAQERLWLALEMRFRGYRDWGMVTELARKYGVSRQFLYQNEALLLFPFSVEKEPQAELSDELIHKLILCLRLYCNASVEDISRTFDEMGWRLGSTGHISEFLSEIGELCVIEIPLKGSLVTLLLDEIFANGQPILVIMEALSHYIMSIKLMPDRSGGTWAAELKKIQEKGVNIGRLVKDQGSGAKAAAQALSLPERADLFHLLKPFDPFLASLERHAYGAIDDEAESLRVFTNRKSTEVLEKTFANCENASAKAIIAIRASDNLDYLHKCLHEGLDSFSATGDLRSRTVAEGDLEATLSLLEEEFPAHKGILKAVKFLRKNLADYWSYFEELELIIKRQSKIIPEHTLRPACLIWQLQRKSMAVKSPAAKKELARQAEALRAFIFTGAEEGLKASVASLFAELDSNVRSSSPLEAINSVIRDSLNACRNQITQEALNLLANFLNHRPATRGKYAGSSPYERLTGLPENGSPIEQLLKLASRSVKWLSRNSTAELFKAA